MVEYSINHVFLSMRVDELNIIKHICEQEQTQLLTILAMSAQNPQLIGYILTGKRSKFLYVEGYTAWLQEFLLFCSPLCEPDNVLILYHYTIKIQ